MSKNSPSEVKLAAPTSGGFPGLKSLSLQVFVMITAIVAVMLFFTWTTNDAHLGTHNASDLLHQTAITDILMVGMVFVVISTEIDFSVGSVMGLLGGITAICDVWLGWPLPLTIIVTLVLGLLLGAWDEWWITYRKVPSFIVTLAGMLASRGILIGITNGTTVSPTNAAMSQIRQSYLPASIGFIIGVLGLVAFVGWQRYGRMRRQTLGLQPLTSTAIVGRQALTAVTVLGATWLLNNYSGIPTPAPLLALLLLGEMFMATRTALERRIYAIGGSLEAICFSGISIRHTKLAVFAINGLIVAIAGLIPSSRLGVGSPSAENIAELDATIACVIGGTSLADGVGSVAGVVMGALIMASLGSGMSVMDIPTF